MVRSGFSRGGSTMSDEQSNSQIGGIAAEALRQFIERIERLEEEKATLSADIKDVYTQAKSQGFDTKIIRKIVSLRKMDDHEREEIDQLLDLYKAAIGMA
jgi:uncharacterized protein (UPF0335 family)